MRIRSQSHLRFVWGFAILWNLIALPATFFGAVPAIQEGRPGAWVALTFPMAGVCALLWAVRMSLRYWRFGPSWLELDDAAATLGGALRARIAAPRLRGDGPILLTLSCINRTVTGSGSNSSTWEKIVWQEEQKVSSDAVEAGPEGALVQVSFGLPFDAPPTRADNPRDRILWRLKACARLSGVDYDEVFEVPVSAAPAGAAQADKSRNAPQPAPGRPDASRILIEADPSGGTRFVLPAFRNLKASLVTGLFASIFVGGAVLFFHTIRSALHGSWFGLLVSGAIGIVLVPFTLLLVLVALHTGFVGTRVLVGPAGLAITSRIFGLSWTQSAPADDVGNISLKIGMQVGMVPYYDLKIERRSGRPLTISAMLRDKREAEWLAAEIRKSLR
ncbi:MAG TPA: hypothetical protein VKF61_05925 [Candidatus Polarisedimenticolia bacterium]|nr:hypothetical protein [Candidatus Polarisedimenticolia bacterium]